MSDESRFIKLMRMTTSSSDGECLNAIRYANNWLKKSKLSWGQVIKDPEDMGYSDPEIPSIRDMFSYITARTSNAFIDSLQEQYAQRGTLSTKQFNALVKFYENAKQRKR